MGRDRPPRQGPGIETTPRYPETTPPMMPSGDYTYVLETVMAMQNSLGKLTEAVDGLKTRQVEQAAKLDKISHKIYAAMALILVFGAILSFFAKSINDVVSERLLAPAFQQQQQSVPIQQPTQQSNPQSPRK